MQVKTTEIASQMAKRLRARGYECVETDTVYQVILVFNEVRLRRASRNVLWLSCYTSRARLAKSRQFILPPGVDHTVAGRAGDKLSTSVGRLAAAPCVPPRIK